MWDVDVQETDELCAGDRIGAGPLVERETSLGSGTCCGLNLARHRPSL